MGVLNWLSGPTPADKARELAADGYFVAENVHDAILQLRERGLFAAASKVDAMDMLRDEGVSIFIPKQLPKPNAVYRATKPGVNVPDRTIVWARAGHVVYRVDGVEHTVALRSWNRWLTKVRARVVG